MCEEWGGERGREGRREVILIRKILSIDVLSQQHLVSILVHFCKKFFHLVYYLGQGKRLRYILRDKRERKKNIRFVSPSLLSWWRRYVHIPRESPPRDQWWCIGRAGWFALSGSLCSQSLYWWTSKTPPDIIKLKRVRRGGGGQEK